MGRTKLRGIECAGVTVSIEVPSNWNWDWAAAPYAESVVLPHDPDVAIGVHVGTPERPPSDALRYSSRGIRFEVGSVDGDWVVAVHGPRGLERSARFDADFRQGEIRVLADAVGDIAHPLVHPLDELILFHRLVREGCLVVDARVRIGDEGVHLFFDAPDAASTAATTGFAMPSVASSLVLRPQLESRGGGDTGVWVYSAPWRPAAEGLGCGVPRARLAELHMLSGDDDGRLPSCHPRSLSKREAANELLRRVNAPMHDIDAIERVAEVVGRIVRAVDVSRVDVPSMSQGFVLDWDAPGSTMGFAPPSM